MKRPSKAETKLTEEQQLKEMENLSLSSHGEIMETILNDDTSKQIWDSMKHKFKGSTRVKKEILRIKKGETVNAYFGRTLYCQEDESM